jgi:phage terminase large subunit-like protein
MPEVTLAEIDAELDRRRYNRIRSIFPSTGQFRRELYPKHLEFFAAGAKYRIRVNLSANRVGKSMAGAYEMALHATGMYEEIAPWWRGKRFNTAVKCWSVGLTGKTTRDSLQVELLGEPGREGTGMIPRELIYDTTPKSGVPKAVDTAYIKSKFGGYSKITFKSNDQGREMFQAESVHVCHLDEECDEDVFDEVLIRTATVGGVVYLTATPLNGITSLVQRFLPGGSA